MISFVVVFVVYLPILALRDEDSEVAPAETSLAALEIRGEENEKTDLHTQVDANTFTGCDNAGKRCCASSQNECITPTVHKGQLTNKPHECDSGHPPKTFRWKYSLRNPVPLGYADDPDICEQVCTTGHAGPTPNHCCICEIGPVASASAAAVCDDPNTDCCARNSVDCDETESCVGMIKTSGQWNSGEICQVCGVKPDVEANFCCVCFSVHGKNQRTDASLDERIKAGAPVQLGLRCDNKAADCCLRSSGECDAADSCVVDKPDTELWSGHYCERLCGTKPANPHGCCVCKTESGQMADQ